MYYVCGTLVGIYQGPGTDEPLVETSVTLTRHSVNEFRSNPYRSAGDGLATGGVNSISSGGGSIVANNNSSSGGGSGGGGTPTIVATSSSTSTSNDVPHSPTPPLQRRLAKSFSVAPSSTQSKGAYTFLFCFLFFIGLFCIMYLSRYMLLVRNH